MEDTSNGYSIDEWCHKRRVSRGTWYNLVKAGKAPRFYKTGSRTSITKEADEEWVREREAVAATEYRAGCEKRRAARTKANKPVETRVKDGAARRNHK